MHQWRAFKSASLILFLRSFPTSTIRVSYLTFTPLAKSCPGQPWLKFGKGGKGAKSDLQVPPNQGRPLPLRSTFLLPPDEQDRRRSASQSASFGAVNLADQTGTSYFSSDRSSFDYHAPLNLILFSVSFLVNLNCKPEGYVMLVRIGYCGGNDYYCFNIQSKEPHIAFQFQFMQ